MESVSPIISSQLTDVVGLRFSGIFPKGDEPSIRTLREWTKHRRIPYHKVGHFVYYDPAEVSAHIRGKLRISANELDAVVVRRQQPTPTETRVDALRLRWSHAGKRSFRISEFKNPCGAISFRVSGRLDGVRIRRNFKTRAEAEAERQVLEVQRMDMANKFRPVVSRLTDAQLQEAEAAFRLLGDKPDQSLFACLEQALSIHAKAGLRKPLGEAVTDYLAERTREHERSVLSISQLWAITRAMNRFRGYFGDQPLSRFTGELLTPFLEQGRPTLKTYNNRRSFVFSFFKYAVRRGWVVDNPTTQTPYYRVAHLRGSAKSITANKAAELMVFVEAYDGGQLVPYFSLCLFAGIRPCFKSGEISRLGPESVMLDTGSIHVEPWVSKVRRKRVVTIQPNLAAWLSVYSLSRFAIIPAGLTANIHQDIFDKFELTHDILRHTFISMFVGKFRSIGEAALQSGNSESIIRKHYLDLKSPQEAEEFFAIKPAALSSQLEFWI